MIAFVPHPKLVSLIYDDYGPENNTVLNLSSGWSGYRDITDLAARIQPINNTNLPMPEFVNSVEFDRQYAEFILNNDDMFYHLIEIMFFAYSGNAVILVQRDPYRDAIMESLIKLIQQRYGYNSWIVEDEDDVACIKERFFTPEGLITFDNDYKRYMGLAVAGRLPFIVDPTPSEEV